MAHRQWTWPWSCSQSHNRCHRMLRPWHWLEKTWRWASDSETAHKAWESIRSEMPIHEIERCHNAKDLGFQLHCSGARELGSRKVRYDNGMKRLLRLSMIPHDLSTKEHILRSSVYPAMFYETEIFRVAIDSLAKVRTAAPEALVGQSHSMSPALVLFLTNGDILDPEFAVLSQALRTAVQWISHQTDAKQKAFFDIAARFQGGTMRTQGPASTLKHYLQNLSWEIDRQGFMHIDGFTKCHLVRDLLSKITPHVMPCVATKTGFDDQSRHSLYSMPDISRCDTLAILKTFSDSERRQLLREISGAYQLESQKAHWTAESDGTCPFCGEHDSKEHRFEGCAAFTHTSESHSRQYCANLMKKDLHSLRYQSYILMQTCRYIRCYITNNLKPSSWKKTWFFHPTTAT